MEPLTVFAVWFGVYFLPLWIAALRGHHQTVAIFVLNVLLGWTFIGWVIALVWSVTATAKPRAA